MRLIINYLNYSGGSPGAVAGAGTAGCIKACLMLVKGFLSRRTDYNRRAMTAELSTNDWAVLALVAERPSHGWALATTLARGGELGSVWAISKPIVYHALDRLERPGLIRPAGLERGQRGPHRIMFAVTARGRRELETWLPRPVEHVSELRSVFLLKVVLSERAGLDPEPLLLAQRATLVPFIGWLEARLDDGAGEAPGEATALAFRLEAASAIVRFIDARLDRSPEAARA
jgi:PadR family transcriptional regulator AphA